jgi:TolB protein
VLDHPFDDWDEQPQAAPQAGPLTRFFMRFAGILKHRLWEKLSGRLPAGRITLNLRSLGLILAINLIVLLAVVWLALVPTRAAPRQSATPLLAGQPSPALLTQTPLPTASLTPASILSTAPAAAAAQPAAVLGELSHGLFVLSLAQSSYAHLFAYQPQSLPLTRLTGSPWDDVTPAISPDGTRIAFVSRQNGYWDLFLLDMTDGSLRRLTDSGAAERAPTWSPDGKWLAFETYALNHSQIAVLSIDDPSGGPMFLTGDAYENRSPAWSPRGRKIAFISTRPDGDSVWIADLDKVDGRFSQVAALSDGRQVHPAWSPDGAYLAWGEQRSSGSTLMIWNDETPLADPISFAGGDWPAWSPAGDLLATRISAPNQDFLAIYRYPSGELVLPPQPLPAPLLGLDWKNAVYPASRPAALAQIAGAQPTPLWEDRATPIAVGPATRFGLTPLAGISAPNASLSDQIDESFLALRSRLAGELGWDFLASLDNAYLPITAPLPPGSEGDWLYTGRAIAVNTAPLAAGWMAVTREDLGGQTYWRVFLKTRFQDGSQGQPLDELPWDISARYGSDPRLYEQGGALAKSIPAGYWLDFTEFAARFGWQRLPADTDWRSFYPGMRFNQLAHTDGQSWRAAMLELYPPEAIATATSIPAATSAGKSARTPTPGPPPSLTPTRRPTWTPLPPPG